jgi:4-amino-4-deoxy-L-arabinose transferase-like glycosyltransferase
MESKNRKIIYLILFVFLIEGVVVALISPPFEAPDENHHIDYINYVLENGKLPVQNIINESIAGEGHQNPLYYIISSLSLKLTGYENGIKYSLLPNTEHIWNGGGNIHVPLFNHKVKIFQNERDRNYFYLLRLLSVVFGLISIFFIFKTLRLFFSELITVLSVSFIVLLPQFVFVNSFVSNDSLTIALTSVSIFYFFEYFLSNKSLSLFLSFFFLGLSVLTKFYPIGFFFLFLFSSLIFKKKKAITLLAIGSIIFLILISPVFVRNILLYDSVWGLNVLPKNSAGLFSYSFVFVLKQFFNLAESFYGKFGWMNVTLPIVIYFLYYLIILLIIGIAITISGKKFFNKIILISLMGILIIFAEVMFYNIYIVQMQGRFLFAAIPFFAIIIGESLKIIFNNFKKLKKEKLFLIAFNFLLTIVSYYFIIKFYK